MDRFMDFIEKHFFKLWVAYVVILICVAAVIVYVAQHFIVKWW